MSEIDESIIRLNNKITPILGNWDLQFENCVLWVEDYKKKIFQELSEIKNEKSTEKKFSASKRFAPLSSDEEYINNKDDGTQSSINTSEKQKRQALKIAQEKINKDVNIKLNTKMRRPENKNELKLNELQLPIKTEIKTESEDEPAVVLNDVTNDIWLENTPFLVLSNVTNGVCENKPLVDMPPPESREKVQRKKMKKKNEMDDSDAENERKIGRVTRSKLKNKLSGLQKSNRFTNSSSKFSGGSDVIFQEISHSIIYIDSNSDSEETKKEDSKNTEGKQIGIEGDKKLSTRSLVKQELTDKQELNDKQKKKSEKGNKKQENKLKPKKKNKEEKVETVLVPVQNEIQELSVYEDAISECKDKSIEKPIIVTNKPLKLPKLSNIKTPTENLNVAGVIAKETPIVSNLNSTHVITSHTLTDSNEIQLQPATQQNMNETFIFNKVAVESSKLSEKLVTSANMFTDDDDSIDPIQLPVEKITKKPIQQFPNSAVKKGLKSKPLFSPYANSPVKKRVAAFKKLEEASANIPAPTSRTRTNTNQNTSTSTSSSQTSKSAVQSKLPVKYFTSSAVKANKIELQERREEEQRRKKEREDEVKRKKEALLQAKIEEQRRKREEKQQKAQQVREAKEKEKEKKLLKMLKEKEERIQQEEKMKMEWAAMKAAEEVKRRKMEEQIKAMKIQRELEKKKKMDEWNRKLNEPPPPLPTGDLENSDDENPSPNYVKPAWAQSENLISSLKIWHHVPINYYENLFQMRAQTPNLKEIFEQIDERMLRRNSSAVWTDVPPQ